jgi:adenosylcobyric acid synthase
MPARAIMIMGTGSDVGKSLIVAGLCRHFANAGFRVAPFKPQNMSNNAAVTEDGGEIGRAQALQARAARCAVTVDLNPVLLKPQSETGAQIVVQGKVAGSARAREFQDRKRALLPAVLESFARLKAANDLIVVEGAGSASEINLRKNDIANMGFAEAAGVPVIVVGDIGRGGVIASLVGTKHVLAPADAARIEGFIVNKMRGDPTLFADGMAAIADMTGWRPLGLVPYFSAASRLPAEDTLGLNPSPCPSPNGRGDARPTAQAGLPLPSACGSGHLELQARRGELAGQGRVEEGYLKIAVPLLPYISNFDDLDPLRLEPGVSLDMVERGRPLPADAGVILLPGSKATVADLEAFCGEGWDIDLAGHVRRGGYVLGLCGGFQMLGRTVSDPDGMEGPPRSMEGLGYLDLSTVLTGNKTLRRVSGAALGAPFQGYEMHMGVTEGEALSRPFLHFADGCPDGAVSTSGLVAGCYVHGLFSSDAFRAAWISALRKPPHPGPLPKGRGSTGVLSSSCGGGGNGVPSPLPYPPADMAILSGNLALARLRGKDRMRGHSSLAYETLIEQTLDELAAHLAAHIDMEALLRLMR